MLLACALGPAAGLGAMRGACHFCEITFIIIYNSLFLLLIYEAYNNVTKSLFRN